MCRLALVDVPLLVVIVAEVGPVRHQELALGFHEFHQGPGHFVLLLGGALLDGVLNLVELRLDRVKINLWAWLLFEEPVTQLGAIVRAV